MEELEIVFDPLPGDSLTRFVTESLGSYNIAATGQESWYPVGFFLKSGRGEWLGGLLGNIWGGWLHVTHLWVAAPVRRHGNGTRLLQEAEKYASERGCFAATLETTSFEAPVLRKARIRGLRDAGRLSARARKILHAQAVGVGSLSGRKPGRSCGRRLAAALRCRVDDAGELGLAAEQLAKIDNI